MLSCNEDVALEIEALEATYGEELTTDESGVSMLLRPLVDAPNDAYVQCELRLGVAGTAYPQQSPSIQLQDAKGLGTCRFAALEARLREEAASMLGEMVLGQLFESAKDWLTEHNWPAGPCIFCLEGLHTSSSSSSSHSSRQQPTGSLQQATDDLPQQQQQQQQQYMRLPCFHAFHQSCFIAWWVWQQQSLLEQQQQLQQKTGATAAAALIQEQLPPKEGDCFQLSCPTCRKPFCLQKDLQHMEQQLINQLQQQQGSTVVGSSSSSSQQDSGVLSEAQLAPFREIQKRHAALFAAQQRREGIITEVNYSIADWDATAAAEAAAAAQTAAVPVVQQSQSSRLSKQLNSRSSSANGRMQDGAASSSSDSSCSQRTCWPAMSGAAASPCRNGSSSSRINNCSHPQSGMPYSSRGHRGGQHHPQQQRQQYHSHHQQQQQQWQKQSDVYPGQPHSIEHPTSSLQQQQQQHRHRPGRARGRGGPGRGSDRAQRASS